jgi:hypothetical protein
VTETVEVETRTTHEGSGGPVSQVTEFCSSPEGEAIERMIEIAENAPPGARCVYAPLDASKIGTRDPALIRRISQVEQEHELTLADVERVEQEGNGEG